MSDEGSDAELVRLARLGNRRAFEGLVTRHGPALYRYGKRMVHDDGATQDCVQETFITAWTSIEHFREESSVKTWLFGIMANKVRREFRRSARQVVVPVQETDLVTDLGPASRAQAAGLLQALERALRTLPTDQRACWILREVEGLTYQQIAEVQAITVGSVRGKLSRARESLGRKLEDWR